MRRALLATADLQLPTGAWAGKVAQGCEAYGGQSERTQRIAASFDISMADFCDCVEKAAAEAQPNAKTFAEQLLDGYAFVKDQAAKRGAGFDAIYEAMDSDEFEPGISDDERFRRFEMKDRIRAAHSFVMRGYRIDNACPA